MCHNNYMKTVHYSPQQTLEDLTAKPKCVHIVHSI